MRKKKQKPKIKEKEKLQEKEGKERETKHLSEKLKQKKINN